MTKPAKFKPETIKIYWELEKDFKLANYFAVRYLFPIDDTTAIAYDPYGFVNDVPTRLDAVLVIKIVDGKLAYIDPDLPSKNDILDMIGAINKDKETKDETIARLEQEARETRARVRYEAQKIQTLEQELEQLRGRLFDLQSAQQQGEQT